MIHADCIKLIQIAQTHEADRPCTQWYPVMPRGLEWSDFSGGWLAGRRWSCGPQHATQPRSAVQRPQVLALSKPFWLERNCQSESLNGIHIISVHNSSYTQTTNHKCRLGSCVACARGFLSLMPGQLLWTQTEGSCTSVYLWSPKTPKSPKVDPKWLTHCIVWFCMIQYDVPDVVMSIWAQVSRFFGRKWAFSRTLYLHIHYYIMYCKFMSKLYACHVLHSTFVYCIIYNYIIHYLHTWPCVKNRFKKFWTSGW